MKLKLNPAKIFLRKINFSKAFAVASIAVTLLTMTDVSENIISLILGINSTMMVSVCLTVMCTGAYLKLLSLNFERENALKTINLCKRIVFTAGFTLLTYVSALVIFMVYATGLYGEWKLLSVSVFAGLGTFFMLFFFILAFKDIHRGIRKELNFRNPPSILAS